MTLPEVTPELWLTGLGEALMVPVSGGAVRLHRDVAPGFEALVAAARSEGLELTPVSGFRSFTRQLALWNGKVRGERAVVDVAGARIEVAALDASGKMEAILRWSALPGASRHHWGTDVDVFDAAAAAETRLTPAEYAEGGPFHALDVWLERNAEPFGFFRPYRKDRGGVAPEPWHLSAFPLAESCLRNFDVKWLERLISRTEDFELREAVLEVLPGLFDRYVRSIEPPNRSTRA